MSCMKRAWKRLFGNTPMRILLLGLDAAGKTTILYQLMGKGGDTVPTIGFNVETVKVPPLEFLVWDVSGQERLRTFWRHYYHGTTGIVFVVDSHDVERLPIAKRELHGILKEEELNDAVLLIIANKTDLPNAVSTERLYQELELSALQGRVMHIQPAVAQKGTGLKEGLVWLAKAMKAQSKQQASKAQQQQQYGGAATSSTAQPSAIQPASSYPSSTAPSSQQQYNWENPYDAQTSNHVASSSAGSGIATQQQQQQQARPATAASSSPSVVQVASVAQPLVVLAPPSSAPATAAEAAGPYVSSSSASSVASSVSPSASASSSTALGAVPLSSSSTHSATAAAAPSSTGPSSDADVAAAAGLPLPITAGSASPAAETHSSVEH